MRDANLVRVLANQSRCRIGLVDLAVVAAGVDAVGKCLAGLAGDGIEVAIADAVFERDLETIGTVALEHRLSVGASGLGLGLARALVRSGRVNPASTVAKERHRISGLAACLAGSCSRATLTQVENAQRAMPLLRLDPEKVVADPAEEKDALAWALERINCGPVLIASSSPPEVVDAFQARHGREAGGRAIEQAMARIAAGLVDHGVRRLVVAGGETSGAVVDRLRIPAFIVGPEIAARVPVLRTVGTKDMLLALKSGNFGGADFFADALELMT
jgi:uncharacterized protein YgbK (DUF1537 family)